MYFAPVCHPFFLEPTWLVFWGRKRKWDWSTIGKTFFKMCCIHMGIVQIALDPSPLLPPMCQMGTVGHFFHPFLTSPKWAKKCTNHPGKKLPIWRWNKMSPNCLGKRLHPPPPCPYGDNTFACIYIEYPWTNVDESSNSEPNFDPNRKIVHISGLCTF